MLLMQLKQQGWQEVGGKPQIAVRRRLKGAQQIVLITHGARWVDNTVHAHSVARARNMV